MRMDHQISANMKMTHFDIILPTIGRNSIHQTLHSVFGQTYKHWTLYIVGDRWTVPLADIEGWPDNVITLYTEGPGDDSGAFTRNAGIHCGKSEWIAYIDDDDEWLCNHLETHARMIEENPGVNMIRTAGQQFKMSHKSPRTSKLVRKMGPVNSTDILTVGMSHTRTLFNETDGWLPCDNHDLVLWKQMLAAGGYAVESEVVTFEFQR